MTQTKIIELLNGIMPEIIESGNPEATMLKCASTHNLSPAQLEKLGHVFNTMKTNVAFEKMANRGNSFSIVDVPEMVSSYQTYRPGAKLSPESKQVHNTVNKLMKEASPKEGKLPTFSMMFTDSDPLMSRGDISFSVEDDNWEAVHGRTPEYDILHKKASAEPSVDDVIKWRGHVKQAKEAFEQVIFDTTADIRERCASIFQKVAWDSSRWQDIAEAIHGALPQEKSAAVLTHVEAYMKEKSLKYTPADMTKFASDSFVTDTYNVLADANDIVDLLAIRKEASSELEKLANQNLISGGMLASYAPSKKDDAAPEEANDLVRSIKSPKKSKSSAKRQREAEFIKNVVPTVNAAMYPFELFAASGEDSADAKHVARGKLQAKQQAAFDSLIMSDDVLRDADQDMLRSLYTTIRDMSPTFASDISLLGPALKESLQYGSIPVHQIKAILDAEKTMLQIKELQDKLGE